MYDANARSNASTLGPMLHQPDNVASSTAVAIASSTSRSDSGTCHVDEAPSASAVGRPFTRLELPPQSLLEAAGSVQQDRRRDSLQRSPAAANAFPGALAVPRIVILRGLAAAQIVSIVEESERPAGSTRR